MRRKLNEKRTIFAGLIVLGLFLIFFVGRAFHPETGKRNFILTTQGVEHFRKWLDVSGGTKLVFKISYDKYEQVYEWAELIAVKKMIEDIILKNIDNRISALGVSDYKSYVQNMDNKPYIVVEIGGVADLDQAKEIIGKTVELEFRLPNEVEPSNTEKQQRKSMAQKLKNDIMESDLSIEMVAGSKWSQNIFYSNLTGLSLGQMPDIFKKNPKLLELPKWEISNILTDMFDVVEYQDMSGNINKTELYWYTFYRINDIRELSRDNITINDIVDIAEQLGYNYDQKISKSETADLDTYDFVWKDLVYNMGAVAQDKQAYDVRVVQVAGNAMIGMEEEDMEQANQQKEKDLKNIQDKIKTQDSFDGWELVVDGWVPQEELMSIISDFDASAVDQVKTYSQLATDYVVYLRDTKSKNDNLFSQLVVENVDKVAFEQKMESKILYDIETVFVQDRETWMTAKSNNGDILNGAYFKYANTDQSQVWLPVVVINFDDKWKEIFCDITADNIGNQMAIFVGWEMMTSPVIRSKICGWTAQIDGDFTVQWAKELVDSLNDGALPAPLVLMQEEKIAPTLGANALKWALIAAAIGILAIFVFIFIAYGWEKSLVTLWVLLSFMIILGWWIKLIDYALSLSGIAAVILSIWMAVDANILIYERKKEEEDSGRTKNSSIDVAYDRSWPAIRDGNISTWLIALLLFMLGSNMFKWFGFMLIVTVLITLFVNVPLTKILLKLAYKNK
jgi:protein-export membrane protein SecD